MKAEILSVGTELLLGEIVDTNAQHLAQHLALLGIDLFFVSQVGDNLGRLVETLQRSLRRSDLIVVTGGLGPTEDDLTREAIAAAVSEKMEVDPELERQLWEMLRRRNRSMPPSNQKQATLIPSAQALLNPIGTAPGWWVEHQGKIVVAMPGVPAEMRKMWDEQVLPRLAKRSGGQMLICRTLKVWGLGESQVEQRIVPFIHSSNPTVATYARGDGVHVRLAAKAHSVEAAEPILAALEGRLRDALEGHVYGGDMDTPGIALGRMLSQQGLTLATMESCTGGLLSSMITDAPGSSGYYRGGVVAYSSEMKIKSGVPEEVVRRHGTVAPETAAAMAQAARTRTGAEVGLAVTGVAGAATLEGKPAGTVHLALDFRGEVEVRSSLHETTRLEVKRRAALEALYMLWTRLGRQARQIRHTRRG